MQTNPDQIAGLSAMQELVERGLLLFAFEEAGSSIIVFDAQTLRLVAANTQAQDQIGAKMRALQKRTLFDIAPRLPLERIRRLVRKLAQRKSRSIHFRSVLKAGEHERLDITAHYQADDKDSIVIFVRKVALAGASQDQHVVPDDRMRTAIEALTDGFILFDADDRLVMCNARYRELYKESASALVPGAKLEDILRYGLQHNQYAMPAGSEDEWVTRQTIAFKNLSMSSEQRLNDGRWLRIVERPTADGGRVGLRMDITHLKDQQDELRRLSRTDDLTGLLNRRGLARRLEVLAAGVAGQMRLAILHVDLDRFKAINDTQGHDAGDFVLQHCAQILSSGRPPADAIARVGGDEFILIIQTSKSEKTVARYAKKLINYLSEPVMFREQSCHVSASIGISFVDEGNASNSSDVLTAADIALNQAKTLGGSEVLVFHPDMRAATIRQTDMAREIQRGIANNEFLPFFQPQIDTETNRVLGFEALIRWHHPILGTVPAFQFLSVAQRAGLTGALDDVVMDRACAALRDLMDWGMKDPCISINLSMGQISDPRIVARLEAHMRRYGVTADSLRIELLESTLLDDRSSVIIQNVHALIAAGFLVELDDFGTGHAAIATLRKFAVSRIKVDRSLVQDIDTDAELQVITAAVIDLANRLGIDALAEGVETGSEQLTLQKMGCYLAQGYLHAKPMSLEDVRPWLQARGDIPADRIDAASA